MAFFRGGGGEGLKPYVMGRALPKGNAMERGFFLAHNYRIAWVDMHIVIYIYIDLSLSLFLSLYRRDDEIQ